ncbi:MAG: hypothetical protein KAG61_08275 [Bacteriovoracaceae bacterium]|nr:hypothetical protein [Bacteriovoracaceae bacterium]
MLDKIIQSIMRYTVLMDKIKNQAMTTYRDALENSIESVVLGIENRNRMISSATKLQGEIVTLVEEFSKSEDSSKTDYLDQLMTIWGADIQKFISTLTRFDEEITSVLSFQKERTSKQINNLYQEKDRVRRFNLNSVR